MKIKLNDIVIPKHMIGRVVEIKKDKIVFERTDMSGTTKTFDFTRKHAETRGVSLEKLITDNLYIVDPNSLKDI